MYRLLPYTLINFTHKHYIYNDNLSQYNIEFFLQLTQFKKEFF